jgi:hypothetical protein
MRKFKVFYKVVKRFPEGTDERIVNFVVDSVLAVKNLITSEDLTELHVEEVIVTAAKKKSYPKPPKVLNG